MANMQELEFENAELRALAEQQKAEIDHLRKDAERYRFLRNRDLNAIDNGGIFAGLTPDNIVLNRDDLDAAIDAQQP